MQKKLLTIILALVLTLALLPAMAMAEVTKPAVNLEKPTNISVELNKHEDGSPYFMLKWTNPQSILELVQYWDEHGESPLEYQLDMKVGNEKWSYDIGTISGNSLHAGYDESGIFAVNHAPYDPINEGNLNNIDINANTYQFRVRYAYDSPDEEGDDYTYSPFSEVASIGVEKFQQKSSDWAKPELEKAEKHDMIPVILQGKDLTKPITREEFAELAVLLYEKTAGKTASPVSPNPFTDTNNPQILKAYAIGITSGTSATTFSPQVLINREQCAAMLYRAIKAINPNANYSITGVKNFPDQKYISEWAVEATKFMFKTGIITGDPGGNFMPKATTSAQQAEGYGMATREAAVLMTVRSYEKVPSLGTASHTPQQPSSSNTSPNISSPQVTAPKGISLPAGLGDIPFAADASFESLPVGGPSTIFYGSGQSLKDLFYMYAEYMKDSENCMQNKQDDEKSFGISGNKNGYKITITIYLSLGSKVSIQVEPQSDDSASGSLKGSVPATAPKELIVKYPASFIDFPFASDTSIAMALENGEDVSILYWSNSSPGSLYNTYYSYLQGSEDFFNYENIEGMYGVTGKKHGYNVAITIMDSLSPLFKTEAAISLQRDEY